MKKSALIFVLISAVSAAAQAGPEVPPGAEALDAAVKRLAPEQQEAVGTAVGMLAFTRNCSEFLDKPSYYEEGKDKVAAGLEAQGISEPTVGQLTEFMESQPRPERPVTDTLCDVNSEMSFTEAVEKERDIRNRLNEP